MAKASDQQAANAKKPTPTPVAESAAPPAPQDGRPSRIVGIGASAGGLHALEQLFKHAPVDAGIAYVVIQHLSPDFKSMMDELLARHTTLPVTHAQEGERVRPNHVYLISPRTDLTVRDGYLHTAAQVREQRLKLPIDVFFASLAEDQREHAVAVVLSGTGSDGTRGIRRIKENGGLVFVQDDATAEFDGMPRSAIDTGLADFILPPDGIAAELGRLMRKSADETAEMQLLNAAPEHFRQITHLLQQEHTVDFSRYRERLLARRIARRMAICGCETLEAYAQRLAGSKEERSALHKDLLIRVTRFYRDPVAWQQLADTIIPAILRSLSPFEPIRIWCAGVSTGEEAYTLAMLVRDQLEATGRSNDVKIFATDVDQEALTNAARGIYPDHIAADLPRPLLERHLRKQEVGYEVRRPTRESVIFARHNLLRDPPFTRLHLVVCRNTLMHFKADSRRRVLRSLHFALRPNGYLMLGAGESPHDLAEGFEPLEPDGGIFRRISLDIGPTTHEPVGPLSPLGSGAENGAELLEHLLEAYAPPALMVNEQHHVAHVLGDVDRYTVMASGAYSPDLGRLLRPELRPLVSAALARVEAGSDPIRLDPLVLQGSDHASGLAVVIEIRAIRLRPTSPVQYVISFIEPDHDHETRQPAALTEDPRDLRITQLQEALQRSEAQLQSTYEEVETSNEELKAANEELMSTNEELQGTNQELHSVNEELYTINAEYRDKIDQLVQLTDDLENLFRSTDLGAVFLDANQCIRRLSPATDRYVELEERDLGRPLAHFQVPNAPRTLSELVRTAVDHDRQEEMEVRRDQDRWMLVRAMPLITSNNSREGAILVFLDITGVKVQQLALAEADQRLAFHVNRSSLAFIEWDAEFRVRHWSANATQLFGWDESETLGRHFRELGFVHPEDRDRVERVVGEILSSPTRELRHRNRNCCKDGRVIHCDWVVTTLHDDRGRLESILTVASDVSAEVRHAESTRAEAEQRYRAAAESSLDALFILRCVHDRSGEIVDFAFADMNARGRALLDVPETELIGQQLCETIPLMRTAGFFEQYRQVFRSGRPLEQEFAIDAPQVRAKWLHQQVVKTADGVAITARDITERKQQEQALRTEVQQLRRLFDQAGVGCALLDPSDRIVRINAALAELLGYAAAELTGGDWSKLVLGDTGAAPGRQRPDPDQTVHLLHRDGTPIAVRLLVEPVEGALLLQVLPAATRADSAGQAT